MQAPLPILYSFRRCPYAIRARLALDVSDRTCEVREVALRDKPAEMLRVSPKGTVPVLIDTDGTVIEESLDVMLWALRRNDPERWLAPEREDFAAMVSLIRHFDENFKRHLDRYKYPNRFVDADAQFSRGEAVISLQLLEARLQSSSFLFGNRVALADMAIAPFVRQFSKVDPPWFASQPLPNTTRWLAAIVDSPRFVRIMRAHSSTSL
ncbi:glutathione S-transferase [Steroidobacter flavus]|uniref:Glutathione S-transferase n=1 Tax=Steroidobacter flavus TaxID=1842136 RepID=A0ABV8SKW7_9GAMM